MTVEKKKKNKKGLGIVLVIFGTIIFFMNHQTGVDRDAIISGGLQTTAMVVRVGHSARGGAYMYLRYELHGLTFENRVNVAEVAAVGENVLIYYSRTNANNIIVANSLGVQATNRGFAHVTSISFIVVGCIIFGLDVVVNFGKRKGRV